MKKRGKEEAICRRKKMEFPYWFTIKKDKNNNSINNNNNNIKDERTKAKGGRSTVQMRKGMG